MSKYLYHVTPIENLSSILEEGLKIHHNNTSAYEDLHKIYLTADPSDLIMSGTYPEIWDYKVLAILKVDVTNLILEQDPEYDPSYDDIDEFVQTSDEDISADLISLDKVVQFQGFNGTSPNYVQVDPKPFY
jgi:hypothetical protein